MKGFQMKKVAASTIAAAALFAASIPGAQAAGPTATFNVTINLASACQVSTAPGNLTLAYNANSPTDVTAFDSAMIVKCTDQLPYTLRMDSATAGVYSVTPDPTTQLNYTLSFDNTGKNGADLAQTGSSAGKGVTIGANIAKNQWGTCSTVGGACSNNGVTHTVYVVY